MAYPKIGNMAPAFSLKNQDGKKVALKDFKGESNVLLYFYPRASTPGCTTQAGGLRDSKAELAKHDCVVLGVSPDSQERLQNFIAKQSLNFDLLSDEDHKITQKYGAWGDKPSGKEGLLRTSYLIGKDGRLKAVLEKFKTTDHHQRVLDLLGELAAGNLPAEIKKAPAKAKAAAAPKPEKEPRNLPEIGSVPPAFTLSNHDGIPISLKDYLGKKNVLIYFYPKALTQGCTVQSIGLRDTIRRIEKLDTVVLGISPDPRKKLQKFYDKEKLNFDLLSDEDHEVAEKYGCWGMKQFMGRHYLGLIRTSFIIGKDGTLKVILDKFKTRTHHYDVLEALAAL